MEALGSNIGVRCVTITGGMGKWWLHNCMETNSVLWVYSDMMTQALALAKKPHVIVCTPGRMVDHLENTKGFSIRTIEFLVCVPTPDSFCL